MQPSSERVAIVTPSGGVAVIPMPPGAPNQLLIAGEPYGKALFQPAVGGPYRFVFTKNWPFEPAMQERVRAAFTADDAAQGRA